MKRKSLSSRRSRDTSRGRSSVSPPASRLKLADARVVKFPAVMGILNVTPDSFSDGGRYLEPGRAVEHALEMEAAGADIVDVGGESTRPFGAREIPVEVELERVRTVLERLGRELRVPISIDTRRAAVARVALDLGAAIINDVTAFTHDVEMAALAAKTRCAVVLMHMRGGPADHMKHARYRDVVDEVARYLRARADAVEKIGVVRSRIILDPGIGFAKNAAHNLELLGALPELCALGYPILVGASRKNFVRRIAGASGPELEFGTAAVNAIAVSRGASIIRVHDPMAARAAVRIGAAMAGRGTPGFKRDA